MYPLLLKAPTKDYLWGGTRLKKDYGFDSETANIAEAWVLSTHKNGACIVKNGTLAGLSLSEAIEQLGKEVLGAKACSFKNFPLLIKLIDARDRLSVQVHPDDAYALKNEGEYGKTEMWYVVDAEPDARLIYGFNRSLNSAELKQRIKNNTLLEVCNFVPVQKGDVFFISAGTLHAIGEGILIAEVQQNSNTTYRVYDYERIGADGKPRQLHIDKAIDVTETAPPTIPYGNVGKVIHHAFGTERTLAECEFFTSKLLRLQGTYSMCKNDSFLSLLVLEGTAELSYSDGALKLNKGDSVFVPAGLEFTLSGTVEVLYAYV